MSVTDSDRVCSGWPVTLRDIPPSYQVFTTKTPRGSGLPWCLGVLVVIPLTPFPRRWVGALGAGAEQARHCGGEIGGSERTLAAFDRVRDLPAGDVLDGGATHLKGLAADPSAGGAGEIANELRDVHRVGRIERHIRRLLAVDAPSDG